MRFRLRLPWTLVEPPRPPGVRLWVAQAKAHIAALGVLIDSPRSESCRGLALAEARKLVETLQAEAPTGTSGNILRFARKQ
jgi:hypothetical protein